MTMNIIAAITALTGVLYLVTAQGCQAIALSCRNFKERKLPEDQRKQSSVGSELRGFARVRHSAMM